MEKSLHILIVEDTLLNRRVLEHFVEQLGHRASSVGNGFDAVLYCESHTPDVVLMDIVMPMMDGFEATRRLREHFQESWVPIIFLTALEDHDSVIKGLEIGGDDYMVKPVDFAILAAKLKGIQRVFALQQLREQDAQRLRGYFLRNEEEQLLARHVMTRLSSSENQQLDNIRTYIRPATLFSGDVVLAMRSTSGMDHLLLADCTGHGLAAAITSLPLIDAFVAMTERGFGISTIVRTINRKLRHSLPTGHFVAAAVVAIDYGENVLAVWNGGIPALAFLTAPGEVAHEFHSAFPALGILPDEDFDNSLSLYRIPAPGTLLMCSDGVLEAFDGSQASFDLGHAISTASNIGCDALLDHIRDSLEEHLGGQEGHDDMSIITAEIQLDMAHERQASSAIGASVYTTMQDWSVTLTLTSTQLKSEDCLSLLTSWINQLGLQRNQMADVLLIVTELFNNALDHGLLRLSSSIKDAEGGFYLYLKERAECLSRLESGFIRVMLQRHPVADGSDLRITVEDSGHGFDVDTVLLNSTGDAQAHGRGLPLIQSRCSHLTFEANGRKAVVEYRL